MGMNPRTLRPGSTFTPRSISGLALWLDAADTQSLYTTDAGPVTAVSAPTEISGCVGWWDASDAASITQSGGLVSQWNDKSGQGNHATASGSARPTLTAGGLNGRSVMTFDGTATAMTVAANAAFNSNDLTYFVVFRQTSTANKGVYTKLNADGTSLGFGLVVRSDPAVWLLQKNAGAPQVLTASVNPTTATRIYTVTSTATATGFLDGLSSATATGQTASHSLSQAVTIGARASSEYLNGYIAEIIHFNTALSTADRARVEAYLAAKWGIAGVHAQATATSDPVGYWRDKSGNNRHFTQSLGSARPTASLAAQNGRNCLTFDGTRRLVSSVPSTQWSFLHDGSQPYAIYAVWQANSGAIRTLVATGDSSQGIRSFYCWHDFGTLASNNVRAEVTTTNAGNFVITRNMGNQTAGVPRALQIIGDLSNATAANRMLLTTNYGAASTASTTGAGNPATGAPLLNLTIGSLSPTSQSFGLSGTLCELVMFNRATVLSYREQALMLGYLNRKWGLVPQVSNADAQDWVNRVYANGGSVSSATATAVNTFCNSIDAAGLRDRFYRLNLFCGTGLAACLVPLYRGPSLGGTQFGNSTDTNNGPFVSGDYAETGSTGGLQGNGSSKFLNTGLPMNFTTPQNYHLSVLAGNFTANNAGMIGADTNGDGTSPRFNQCLVSYNTSPRNNVWFNYGTNFPQPQNSQTYSSARFVGTGSASSSILYANSVSVGTDVAAGSATNANTYPLYVFALNNRNVVTQTYANCRISAYSAGLNMSAAQVASYDAALAAFAAALGRA